MASSTFFSSASFADLREGGARASAAQLGGSCAALARRRTPTNLSLASSAESVAHPNWRQVFSYTVVMPARATRGRSHDASVRRPSSVCPPPPHGAQGLWPHSLSASISARMRARSTSLSEGAPLPTALKEKMSKESSIILAARRDMFSGDSGSSTTGLSSSTSISGECVLKATTKDRDKLSQTLISSMVSRRTSTFFPPQCPHPHVGPPHPHVGPCADPPTPPSSPCPPPPPPRCTCSPATWRQSR